MKCDRAKRAQAKRVNELLMCLCFFSAPELSILLFAHLVTICQPSVCSVFDFGSHMFVCGARESINFHS